MEKYVINGREIEYDTFDQINLELFDSERRRALDKADELENCLNEENAISSLRELCEVVRDFFDTVLGDGAALDIFGERRNAVKESSAMVKFIADVNSNMKKPQWTVEDIYETFDVAETPVLNKQQRREQERKEAREKRRKEAAMRAAGNMASVMASVSQNSL